MTTEWGLKPGQKIDRAALHETYGGRTQAAIAPSKQTPNVFLFAGSPAEDEDRGIFSGWRQDGLFYFPGEGPTGDQKFISGNQAVADHMREHRALRLFHGRRGEVEYVGEFTLASLPNSLSSWTYCDAPEHGGGPLRQIIMFHLNPVDTKPEPGRIGKLESLMLCAPESEKGVGEVPIETRFSEEGMFYPSREPDAIELQRRRLIQTYARHLEREGRAPTRKVIFPDGGGSPKFTDLFDDTDNTLIEAAGSLSQPSLQNAIGRLLDLCRHRRQLGVEHAVLLLPGGRYGHLDLLASELNIEIVFLHKEDRPPKKPELMEFVSIKPDPTVSEGSPSFTALKRSR